MAPAHRCSRARLCDCPCRTPRSHAVCLISAAIFFLRPHTASTIVISTRIRVFQHNWSNYAVRPAIDQRPLFALDCPKLPFCSRPRLDLTLSAATVSCGSTPVIHRAGASPQGIPDALTAWEPSARFLTRSSRAWKTRRSASWLSSAPRRRARRSCLALTTARARAPIDWRSLLLDFKRGGR